VKREIQFRKDMRGIVSIVLASKVSNSRIFITLPKRVGMVVLPGTILKTKAPFHFQVGDLRIRAVADRAALFRAALGLRDKCRLLPTKYPDTVCRLCSQAKLKRGNLVIYSRSSMARS
jgi:hypothetical protein